MKPPRRETPLGHCLECDGWHRVDAGCDDGRLLAPWLVGILSVALLVIGVALWRRAVGS